LELGVAGAWACGCSLLELSRSHSLDLHPEGRVQAVAVPTS